MDKNQAHIYSSEDMNGKEDGRMVETMLENKKMAQLETMKMSPIVCCHPLFCSNDILQRYCYIKEAAF